MYNAVTRSLFSCEPRIAESFSVRLCSEHDCGVVRLQGACDKASKALYKDGIRRIKLHLLTRVNIYMGKRIAVFIKTSAMNSTSESHLPISEARRHTVA